MPKLLLLLSLLMWLPIGCGPRVESRRYQVTVANASSGPVTVYLTKSGGPYEEPWASPEDLAHPAQGESLDVEGIVLQPGEIGELPGEPGAYFEGKFYTTSDAVLRVYSGRRTFNEMLAASREAGTLKVFILPPGRSAVTVRKHFPVEADVQVQPGAQ